MGMARHRIYRLGENGEPLGPEPLTEFEADFTHYQLHTPDRLVAEGMLVGWLDTHGADPGMYRVVVDSTYSGHHVTTVDRPWPIPEEWARLSMWHSKAGEFSKFFADNVLTLYRGSTVETVGKHLASFADHYHGRITTAELARRTGYVFVAIANRPCHPNVVIDPSTDLAKTCNAVAATDHGTCDTPLDGHGQCVNARRHIDM